MLLQLPVSQSQSVPIPHLNIHLNIPEAALVSPREMAWDDQRCYSADAMDVTWNYYTLPPSPPASISSNADDSPRLGIKLIRPPLTPESQSPVGEHQPCLPTSQVFDLDNVDSPSSPSSASPPPSIPHQLILSSGSGGSLKRTFSTIGGGKRRGSGERITTRDFVPPDVTGLSKREARLLKNRAAAFLSRQRKREEFEAMEIRVKELEEENSQLQALVEKGKKYDDLLLNMEQLRLRLSVAEKREQELTVELANRTVANLAMKTEPHDLNLPSPSYSSCATMGQASVITVMKQSLLSSLPSLLSLSPEGALPISFSIPLTGFSSSRPSPVPFTHHPASCDIKNQGRPRFGHGNVASYTSSADIELLKKLAVGGESHEPRQFDVDGPHCFGSFAISFDIFPTEDGRGCLRVHVSERMINSAVHGPSRQGPPSLTSWPGADTTFAMAGYVSPPMSAPISTPSPGSVDPLGVFASAGNTHSKLGFDTQLVSPSYSALTQHDPDQTFDYYPGLILE